MERRHTPGQRLAAECLGTAFLLATVIGSGIMGERLSGGNVAIALLGNTIPTGAILFVLITMLGPISGAHFNPAVTAAFALRRGLPRAEACNYVFVQLLGAVVGVLAAHLMFEESLLQISTKVRAGPAQWFSEWVAAFGLVATILLTLRANRAAVTIARSLSNTFAGIRPLDVLPFVAAQMLGAVCAVAVCRRLLRGTAQSEKERVAAE